MKLLEFTEAMIVKSREVGLGRRAKAIEKKRKQPHGDPGHGKHLYSDCYGALAECGVAAWLDLPWHCEILDDLSVKPPDVGTRVEVRHTKYPNGHLQVKPKDPDDWIIVGVRGELPSLYVYGWTTGLSGKQEYHKGHKWARSPEDYYVAASSPFMLTSDLLPSMRKSL